MSGVRYELHSYQDPEYPMIFHFDTLNQGVRITPHWHINIELLYVQRGTISVQIENRTIIANRGEIVVINSNCVHTISSLTPESFYFCLIIDYNFCKKLGFDTVNSRFKSLSDDLEMKNIFQLIINEGTLQKQYYKKAIRALCHTMLILLHRNQLSECLVEEDDDLFTYENVGLVKKIIDYVQDHSDCTVSLDDLATHTAISKFHMCRVFKEITCITINHYITQVRLEKAKELLLEDEMSIADIAEACGFQSLSYFTKTYKKHYGHSPSQAKKSQPKVSDEIYKVNLNNPVESSKEYQVMISKFI